MFGFVNGHLPVVNVVAVNPDFAIIIPWTGRRAGADLHVFEGFHQAILTYSPS
jgi:enoyl reductase-like protein